MLRITFDGNIENENDSKVRYTFAFTVQKNAREGAPLQYVSSSNDFRHEYQPLIVEIVDKI